MKILSLVSLVDPAGAYGGPTRVAVNQARALRERGHEVTVLAAHRGFSGPPPTQVDGVPARLFPARRLVPATGFAGLTAPALLRFLRAETAAVDVVHVHLARDLVTLPAATLLRRAGVPYVVQTHGMIDASSHPLARVLDPWLTVPALRAARSVLYLSERERRDLDSVGSDLSLRELPNGVPATDLEAKPGSPEVLYLARLAPRKRPGLFVETAGRLAPEFPGVRFRLVGPDEGEAGSVQAAAAAYAADIAWEGALAPADTLPRLARAGVFVLPAVDEPYPMSVLEALSVGLPVVITDSCGLAPFVERAGCGIVVGPDLDSLTAGVRRLLTEPSLAAEMGVRGRNAVRSELSMSAIAAELELVYETATTRGH